MDAERYAFRLEHFDELASCMRSYTLLYFVRLDGADQIEIFDNAHKRRFLSRVHYPALKLADIVIGAKVTIYSRQYKVVDFDDDHTRRALGKAKEQCCAIITGRGVSSNALPQVWRAVEQSGLRVAQAYLLPAISAEDAASVSSGTDAPVSPGPLVVLNLVGEDSRAQWGRVAEHLGTSGAVPAESLALCVPAHEERIRNAFFGPEEGRLPSTKEVMGGLENCACVMVLPSAVLKNNTGVILAELYEKLGIGKPGSDLAVTAMGMYDIDRRTAEDFLEVYKFVVPNFNELAAEYASGPLLALEVTGTDAVARVRSIVGPREVEVAKRIRPDTLRARYGVSSSAPGIHCTDLAEDGPLECEFLFGLLRPR